MRYECSVCGYIFDEDSEGCRWDELPEDWECPVCGADHGYFDQIQGGPEPAEDAAAAVPPSLDGEPNLGDYLAEWKRSADDVESQFATIQQIATSGKAIIEPMRTRKPVVSWDDILVCGAQLATLPLNNDIAVNTRTVIGRSAKKPLEIETPIFVSHMSLGALSKEAKIALAKGSAAVETAMCSGEGGILPESLEAAHRYIFEYVPNRYSVTDDNLKAVDAIEIKIGQSAKPGLGGHLPATKVTEEIAEIRGFPAGEDIVSPAHFPDITNAEELRKKVDWLRKKSAGRPIGIKLAAGHIEADLEIALAASPDFVTIDGRPGATGAAPKTVKDATAVPTIFALSRARRYLDSVGADNVSLVITGGLRIASDFAKALALGADAVAVASAALIACGCQQYRICDTGRCPVGITTQDPELRSRFSIELSAQRLENFLRVASAELEDFARLTGHDDIHALSANGLRTVSPEIAKYTDIAHVGEPGNSGAD
jgi:glutamate synthase domain-containing protein 2/rubredoxin